MSDPNKQSLATIPTPPGFRGIRQGDTFTIAGVYHLVWWKRALIRLGLLRPPEPPPPLTVFTVTNIIKSR